MTIHLSALVAKALADSGYDVLDEAEDGWTRAGISGQSAGQIFVRPTDSCVLLAVGEKNVTARVGLSKVDSPPPGDMQEVGSVATPEQLFRALCALHSLQTHPIGRLKQELEDRLNRVVATERTQEVRQRIGQEVFRDALMQFWANRCALTGRALPLALLRASHAKPWADSNDDERLDPFNGLLLAVRHDALFDKGLIAFDDSGRILISRALDSETRGFVGLNERMRLRLVMPGHSPYLQYHRERIAKL